MKPLVILLILIASSVSAQSQLAQGTWLAGGTGKFYSYTVQYTTPTYSNEAKYTQIDLSPAIGYFVMDKLAFGLKPTFSSMKGEVTTPGGGRTNLQRYWLGPFGRYYILDMDRVTNIVTDLSYQVGFFGGEGFDGKLRTLSALAGPVVFFNSSVSVEFLLGYSYSKEDAEQYQKDVRKGFHMGIGLQVYLEN